MESWIFLDMESSQEKLHQTWQVEVSTKNRIVSQSTHGMGKFRNHKNFHCSWKLHRAHNRNVEPSHRGQRHLFIPQHIWHRHNEYQARMSIVNMITNAWAIWKIADGVFNLNFNSMYLKLFILGLITNAWIMIATIMIAMVFGWTCQM